MSEGLTENKIVINAKANEILEVIMSYARLDFTPKTKISSEADVFDAIGAGVNMLGEELKISTVSLIEKEQLLKEVHHRVKNNLQVIISLINLQCELVTDKANRESLSGFRDRIKSMALVHEMLYTSSNISKINLGSYIKNLVQQLSFTFEGNRNDISFDLEIDESLNFEMDKMTPLGLILNEIISNSLKHAFGNGKGVIFIKAQKNEANYHLVISDSGKGLQLDFDINTHANLGMQLIQILCEQIDSSLKIGNKNGVVVEMKF